MKMDSDRIDLLAAVVEAIQIGDFEVKKIKVGDCYTHGEFELKITVKETK